ncbi:hypothetical protein B0H11DRAFT_2188740 [Mycena galericulata]|nr:hypothetical protein B0H11DRAFT_2188740 [Mycena galericulata]
MRRMLSSCVDGTVGVDGSRGAKVRGRAAGVRGVSHRTTWRGATPKDGRRAVSGKNRGRELMGEERACFHYSICLERLGRERGWYISAIMKARASLTEREMCGMGDDILREGQRTKMSHPSRLFGVQISARDEMVPRVSLVRKAHKRSRWTGPDAERKKGCLTFEMSLRIGIVRGLDDHVCIKGDGEGVETWNPHQYQCWTEIQMCLTLGTKEATTRRPTPKKDIQMFLQVKTGKEIIEGQVHAVEAQIAEFSKPGLNTRQIGIYSIRYRILDWWNDS